MGRYPQNSNVLSKSSGSQNMGSLSSFCESLDLNSNFPEQRQVRVKLVSEICEREIVIDSRNLRYLQSYFDEIPSHYDLKILKIPPINERMIEAIVKRSMKKPPTYERVVCIESSFVCVYQIVSEFERRCITSEISAYHGQVRANNTVNASLLRGCSPWDFEVDAVPVGHPIKLKIASCEFFYCSSCQGSQEERCHECYGTCLIPCEGCCTDACDEHEVCEDCQGAGSVACHECNGRNSVDCEHCTTGKFEKYLQLNIERKEQRTDVYTDNLYQIPEWFLHHCTATTIYKRAPSEGYVNPITKKDCLNLKIVEASQNLVKAHRSSSTKNRKLMKMNHTYSVMPLFKVVCERKGKLKNFWIGGNNCQVYYPRRFK